MRLKPSPHSESNADVVATRPTSTLAFMWSAIARGARCEVREWTTQNGVPENCLRDTNPHTIHRRPQGRPSQAQRAHEAINPSPAQNARTTAGSATRSRLHSRRLNEWTLPCMEPAAPPPFVGTGAGDRRATPDRRASLARRIVVCGIGSWNRASRVGACVMVWRSWHGCPHSGAAV